MSSGRIRRAFDALGEFVERYGAETGSGFFNVIITIVSVVLAAGILPSAWFWCVVVSAFGCLVFFVLAVWSKERERRKAADNSRREEEAKARLTQEKEQVEKREAELICSFRELLATYIRNIADKRLEFGTVNGCLERITLYALNDNVLHQIYRHSNNPGYACCRDRHNACIARVWDKGFLFEDDFPDPVSAPGGYKTKHKNIFGLQPEEVESLNMKSRIYFGHRIAKEQNHAPVGVVIVEATENKRFRVNALTKVFAEEQRFFAELLERVLPHAGY